MIKEGKFFKHLISDDEQTVIQTASYPKGLSLTDKTVLFLAQKVNAMVLSSDNLIRKTAEKSCIERHGLIWIFDQLVIQSCLSESDAKEKLQELKSLNLMYHNNPKLTIEIEKRIKRWSWLVVFK